MPQLIIDDVFINYRQEVKHRFRQSPFYSESFLVNVVKPIRTTEHFAKGRDCIFEQSAREKEMSNRSRCLRMTSKKYFIATNPQFKTVDLYNEQIKKIKREVLLQPELKSDPRLLKRVSPTAEKEQPQQKQPRKSKLKI